MGGPARRPLTGRRRTAERRHRPAPRAPRPARLPAPRPPQSRGQSPAGQRPAAHSAPRPARLVRGTGNGYEAISPPRFLLSHCLPGNGSLSWESTLVRRPQEQEPQPSARLFRTTAPPPPGLPRAPAQAKVPPRGAGSLALGFPASGTVSARRPPSPPAAPSPPGPLCRPLPWTPTAARPGRSWRGPAPCTCRQGTC